ncbi:hypothetical protein KFL_001000130 [Klebsormidium nitens]|uniref:Endonuclease I n=1 Tax=Klebsormidium nitens TaxID=105231 RepID=A0A1Y1HYS3_KLENI|nr:hypothetical protein KFL_001000130 [Klebsormidium nitens]|eukprot:GAQ82091.1 hypothetical protein KFL_001000130 [Klebsormidium nitens]
MEEDTNSQLFAAQSVRKTGRMLRKLRSQIRMCWREFLMRCWTHISQDGLPCESVSSYYAPLAGLKGQALKTKLHDIVAKDARSFSYAQVWDALYILDAADTANPTASPDVIDIYSKRTFPKLAKGLPTGWNREHLWPRSYGLPDGTPQFTDLHNLRPADTNVNSSRGNKAFGECSRETDATCLIPANREAGSDTAANREIWTPPGEVRGDIARALFYMAVRYEGETPGSKDLELSDEPSIERGQMGRLSTLLKWHAADPPSASERLRNDRVCTMYQKNRNPFVDRPELVAAIWGTGPPPTNGGSSEPRLEPSKPQTPPKVPASNQPGAVWVNEFHYNNTGRDEGEFIEILVGANVDPRDVVVYLYNGADRGVYRTLAVGDGSLFEKGEVTSGGATLYVCQLPPNGLQNGPADGIAVTVGGRVVDFVSYDGTLTAASGPAEGLTSTPIEVRESEQTEKGSSVGLVDAVKKLWQVFRQATPGLRNQ